MLFTKDRPKTHQEQSQLSTEEAFRLWEKTRLRYDLISLINLLGNFTHDIDFQLVLKNLNETFQKQARILENEINKYSIKSPKPSKRDIEAIGNAEVIEDKLTARLLYDYLQLIVSKCFLVIRDSVFNDALRELLFKITKEDIEEFDKYSDYVIDKGWLEEPPLYKSVKNSEKRVASNEIWNLWTLLHRRYLDKQQTKYYISYVMDKDFELILKTGMSILEDQVDKLEEKLLYYGVNLPEKFPENIPSPESKEMITDEYIYQALFFSMIDAVTLEGFSVEELIINSDIRKMLKGFVFKEMDVINNIIKYGKIKGWIPLVPQFRTV